MKAGELLQRLNALKNKRREEEEQTIPVPKEREDKDSVSDSVVVAHSLDSYSSFIKNHSSEQVLLTLKENDDDDADDVFEIADLSSAQQEAFLHQRKRNRDADENEHGMFVASAGGGVKEIKSGSASVNVLGPSRQETMDQVTLGEKGDSVGLETDFVSMLQKKRVGNVVIPKKRAAATMVKRKESTRSRVKSLDEMKEMDLLEKEQRRNAEIAKLVAGVADTVKQQESIESATFVDLGTLAGEDSGLNSILGMNKEDVPVIVTPIASVPDAGSWKTAEQVVSTNRKQEEEDIVPLVSPTTPSPSPQVSVPAASSSKKKFSMTGAVLAKMRAGPAQSEMVAKGPHTEKLESTRLMQSGPK